MTLQEFYDRIGGDYKATISRLPSEALIKKFVLKYPGDPSFNQPGPPPPDRLHAPRRSPRPDAAGGCQPLAAGGGRA